MTENHHLEQYWENLVNKLSEIGNNLEWTQRILWKLTENEKINWAKSWF